MSVKNLNEFPNTLKVNGSFKFTGNSSATQLPDLYVDGNVDLENNSSLKSVGRGTAVKGSLGVALNPNLGALEGVTFEKLLVVSPKQSNEFDVYAHRLDQSKVLWCHMK
jgi:hypothetical protein